MGENEKIFKKAALEQKRRRALPAYTTICAKMQEGSY
jgi:hypothetical protein